jgi:SAM-dependent methyltransferase
MVDSRTAQNLRQWERKPSLRAVYQDLYRKMANECLPGATLEIGGGSGNFKQYRNDVVTSDITCAPWLDLVADAQTLPFRSGVFSNIVMFDVLHHVEVPRAFLAEAQRVLIPGGRIIMVEPAITPLSWFFYHFVHQEPVDLSADPLLERTPNVNKDPYSANQAVPTLLVTRHAQRLTLLFPKLRVCHVRWLSLFAYPLSGGFKPWSLIPYSLIGPVLRFEDVVSGIIGRLLGFRVLIAIEKRPLSSTASPAASQ